VVAEHRRQGILIGGIVTLFVGVALSIFLHEVADGNDGGRVWTVGLIPAAVGVALILSSFLIRPVGGGSGSPPQSMDR
jgi:hypothetical protein